MDSRKCQTARVPRQSRGTFPVVKLRSIRREILDAQAAMSMQQQFDRSSLVRGGVIQQKDHRAAQVTQQFTQKHTDLILPDVVIEEKTVVSG